MSGFAVSYVPVSLDDNDEPIELPCEEDNTLLLTTLSSHFPGACGLKYKNDSSGMMRLVRLVDGRLLPPDDDWGKMTYQCVFPKVAEQKRKQCDEVENDTAKTKKIDKSQECSDLIVLGLPWKTTRDELKEYFEKFGEVLMAEVKKDPESGMSKGFGFIRFAKYESQIRALLKRHMIDGRWCEVKIPNSNEDKAFEVSSKVFIGRCSEDITADDLSEYFSKFGEVTDVYIPKPFRAFAFVTFLDATVAQNLCGEDHLIKGTSVHVSKPIPKNETSNVQGRRANSRMPGNVDDGYYDNGANSYYNSSADTYYHRQAQNSFAPWGGHPMRQLDYAGYPVRGMDAAGGKRKFASLNAMDRMHHFKRFDQGY